MSLLRHAVVGLDGSRTSESALTVTLHLVQPGLGRVTGCYVEDASLRRAAHLSTTRTVPAGRGTAVPLSTRHVERSFQDTTDYVRWRLNELAHTYSVDAELQSVEGRAASALLEAERTADLVAVGMQGTTNDHRYQLGHTPLALIREATCSLLMSPRHVPGLNHVTVYFSEGPDGATALQWATYASYALHVRRVRVLLPAADDAAYAKQRESLRKLRPPADVLWQPVRCTPLAAQRPGTALHRALDGLVVAPLSFVRDDVASVRAFLHELQQPLLLARQPDVSPQQRPKIGMSAVM
jgi:nucleotide-binding universal stress UspA family protein